MERAPTGAGVLAASRRLSGEVRHTPLEHSPSLSRLAGRPVYLKVDLGAGHMGPSGRYDAWRDEALVMAFLLDALEVGA